MLSFISPGKIHLDIRMEGCYLFQLITPLFVKITILSKDIIIHHSYDFMVSFCMVQMIISMASPSFNLNNKNAPQLAKKKKR